MKAASSNCISTDSWVSAAKHEAVTQVCNYPAALKISGPILSYHECFEKFLFYDFDERLKASSLLWGKEVAALNPGENRCRSSEVMLWDAPTTSFKPHKLLHPLSGVFPVPLCLYLGCSARWGGSSQLTAKSCQPTQTHTAKSRDETPSDLPWDKCVQLPAPTSCSGDADTVFDFYAHEKPRIASERKTEKMQSCCFIPFEVAETTYRLAPLLRETPLQLLEK